MTIGSILTARFVRLDEVCREEYRGAHREVLVGAVDTGKCALHVDETVCGVHLRAHVAQRHRLRHPLNEPAVLR